MDVEFPQIDPANPIGDYDLVYVCTNKAGVETKRSREILIVPSTILNGEVVIALAFSIAAVLVCLTTSAKIYDLKQQQEIHGLGQAKKNRSMVETPDCEDDDFGVEMQRIGSDDDDDEDENDRLIVV